MALESVAVATMKLKEPEPLCTHYEIPRKVHVKSQENNPPTSIKENSPPTSIKVSNPPTSIKENQSAHIHQRK